MLEHATHVIEHAFTSEPIEAGKRYSTKQPGDLPPSVVKSSADKYDLEHSHSKDDVHVDHKNDHHHGKIKDNMIAHTVEAVHHAVESVINLIPHESHSTVHPEASAEHHN